MRTSYHKKTVLRLKDRYHSNTRPLHAVVLALFLALGLLASTAAPVFAQTPNILVDDYVTISQNEGVEIEVFGNDTLPDFASFDFTRPENGDFSSFSYNAFQPFLSFAYTPDMDFVGSDSFVYSVLDSDRNGSSATVHITINRAPDPSTGGLNCSTCLIRHEATPVNITVGEDGAFNLHFIGDDGVASGPLLPPVQKLTEMYSPGSGNIVLFSGANPKSGAPVVISYLSTEQVVHVNTTYLNRHDGSMKPYIFVINQDNEASHWEW